MSHNQTTLLSSLVSLTYPCLWDSYTKSTLYTLSKYNTLPALLTDHIAYRYNFIFYFIFRFIIQCNNHTIHAHSPRFIFIILRYNTIVNGQTNKQEASLACQHVHILVDIASPSWGLCIIMVWRVYSVCVCLYDIGLLQFYKVAHRAS